MKLILPRATAIGIVETAEHDKNLHRTLPLEEATRKSVFWCEEKNYFYKLDREEPDIKQFNVPPLISTPFKSS